MKKSSLPVYVVEDDDWYRKLLVHTLSLNPDHEVAAFADGESLLEQLQGAKEAPFLITIDFRLPGISGAELLQKLLSQYPDVPVVVISEQQDIETAVGLLREGAYDYLTKTNDIRDRLVHLLNHLNKNRKLEERVAYLEEEVTQKYDFQKSIIGQSAGLQRVFKLIEKATTNNITVMITGETGTGKEVVAKAIHYGGKQKKGPFVPVNMSAIPSELVESELFGYEKGAFTGAAGRHIGKFEQANGGTLFLDEIAEMDVTLQAKLLRALQEKEVSRLGSQSAVKIDCRVIVATHRNLAEAIKQGKFREDLYYRLFGLPIELPPLRERDKDVVLLAKHFVDAFAKENGMDRRSFSKEALQKMMNYPFPGNIRELKSVVELAAVLTDNPEIQADDIVFAQSDLTSELLTEEMTMKDYQLKIIQLFLRKYDNDIKLVAEKLDMGQSTIYRLLKEHPELSQK